MDMAFPQTFVGRTDISLVRWKYNFLAQKFVEMPYFYHCLIIEYNYTQNKTHNSFENLPTRILLS